VPETNDENIITLAEVHELINNYTFAPTATITTDPDGDGSMYLDTENNVMYYRTEDGLWQPVNTGNDFLASIPDGDVYDNRWWLRSVNPLQNDWVNSHTERILNENSWDCNEPDADFNASSELVNFIESFARR
jgi:hypothetical protein